jgi:EAL domain-containing protein (putative c-di-GMP-specific phosphodiesterase class I)
MARRSRIGRLRAAVGWGAADEPVSDVPTVLASGALVALTWDLASDSLTLEAPHRCNVTTGSSFADLVDAQDEADRRDAILRACPDEPGSARYRCRYTLRLSRTRSVTVDETGRCFFGVDGRPFRAESLLRVEGEAGPGRAGSRSGDRFAVLAAIAETSGRTGHSNRAGTLIVGMTESGQVDGEAGFARAARLARPLLRRDDRLMPLGENAFVLLLPSCPGEEAPAALARLQHLLHVGEDGKPPFRLASGELSGGAVDPGQALRSVERGLMQTSPAAADLHAPATAALLDTLNGRTLDLLLRPVVEAASRQTAYHVAVAALPTPSGPSAAPELRHVADEAGLSLLLDSRLLELAADRLVLDPCLRIALPVAGSTLADREWLTIVAAHLGARPGIGSRLLIETSARGLARHRTARGRLTALKALGVGTVLSGVGIPAAAPERALRNLSLDILTIDGRLAQAFRRSPEDGERVRRLVDLAQRLGSATCAAWVDDPSLARALALAGVDYLEGPLFPASASGADRQKRANGG